MIGGRSWKTWEAKQGLTSPQWGALVLNITKQRQKCPLCCTTHILYYTIRWKSIQQTSELADSHVLVWNAEGVRNGSWHKNQMVVECGTEIAVAGTGTFSQGRGDAECWNWIQIDTAHNCFRLVWWPSMCLKWREQLWTQDPEQSYQRTWENHSKAYRSCWNWRYCNKNQGTRLDQ